MSDEIVKAQVDPTQFPEAAHKHARRAMREHQRAEHDVLNAVQHAVKSGQALLKAYDLCEYGQWEGFLEMHFQQVDEDHRLSLRTARIYMRLARNWSRLTQQHPDGFSSQRHALKALAAILQADKSDPSGGSSAARCRSADATASGAKTLTATVSPTQRAKKRRRTGPVWRASGPFVEEALDIVRSINDSLTKLIGQGYPFGDEAENVNAALVRLQRMIDSELDECEAQQARGEMIWVMDESSRGLKRGPDGLFPAHRQAESGATALTPALSQGEREKTALTPALSRKEREKTALTPAPGTRLRVQREREKQAEGGAS